MEIQRRTGAEFGDALRGLSEIRRRLVLSDRFRDQRSVLRAPPPAGLYGR